MKKEGLTENERLQFLWELEDLAEKKANIYGRLLMDSGIAQKMQSLAGRHAKRKERLEILLFGKAKKEKK